LILYYAIAARGRADAAWTWSAVESILVTIPEFTQEFSGVLNGLSVCTSSSASVYALDSIDFGSVEDFPTGTESGGLPLTNDLKFPFQLYSVTITGIEIVSDSDMSADATIKYISSTSGTGGNFIVGSVAKTGNSGNISEPVSVGDQLQIWSLDPKGIGHFQIRISFTRS